MSLLDCFERIYIVNLPERSDRRREMDQELRRIGLRVDDRRIHYWRASRPDDAGAFPSRGARGCFLSHLAILNEAIDQRLNNVLVLEDDLSFDPRLLQVPADMAQRLTGGQWDFAYLGHVEPLPASTPTRWQENTQPMATTHFYGLNGRVLRPLRDHLEACLRRPSGHPQGSPMHVDGAYSLFRQFHPETITLMASPSLGGQRSSRSDIYPNQWYDQLAPTRLLATLARSLKNRLTRRPLHAQEERHV